jgi:hypothetical protein
MSDFEGARLLIQRHLGDIVCTHVDAVGANFIAYIVDETKIQEATNRLRTWASCYLPVWWTWEVHADPGGKKNEPEVACPTCTKKNDVGVKTCWWCGGAL